MNQSCQKIDWYKTNCCVIKGPKLFTPVILGRNLQSKIGSFWQKCFLINDLYFFCLWLHFMHHFRILHLIPYLYSAVPTLRVLFHVLPHFFQLIPRMPIRYPAWPDHPLIRIVKITGWLLINLWIQLLSFILFERAPYGHLSVINLLVKLTWIFLYDLFFHIYIGLS